MGIVAPWHVESLRPEMEPLFPAMAGGFLSTGPPGKSSAYVLDWELTNWHVDYIQFVACFCNTCELRTVLYL